MQAQNLNSPKELQGYFMTRGNAILKKYGKTCIAWNDCINDNFDSSIICQYWFPNNLAAVRKQVSRRDFILSPENYFYFDEKLICIQFFLNAYSNIAILKLLYLFIIRV